jgi:hypothetical protein
VRTVLDHEHAALERLIRGAAQVAHSPGVCDLCARLNMRRRLDGFADLIEASRKVNNTPHKPAPITKRPPPKPGTTAPKPKPPPDKGGKK